MLKLLGKMRPKIWKQHLDLKHEEGMKPLCGTKSRRYDNMVKQSSGICWENVGFKRLINGTTMHVPENGNDYYKLLWDFSVQTDK